MTQDDFSEYLRDLKRRYENENREQQPKLIDPAHTDIAVDFYEGRLSASEAERAAEVMHCEKPYYTREELREDGYYISDDEARREILERIDGRSKTDYEAGFIEFRKEVWIEKEGEYTPEQTVLVDEYAEELEHARELLDNNGLFDADPGDAYATNEKRALLEKINEEYKEKDSDFFNKWFEQTTNDMERDEYQYQRTYGRPLRHSRMNPSIEDALEYRYGQDIGSAGIRRESELERHYDKDIGAYGRSDQLYKEEDELKRELLDREREHESEKVRERECIEI
jgi:hypothetical protein